MAKKTTKTKPKKAPELTLQNVVLKLRAENKALRKRVAELEQRPTLGEVYSGKDAADTRTGRNEIIMENSFRETCAAAGADPAAVERTTYAPEIIAVQVGPLMPWETALPNSFEGK